jgi:tellurite resistance protein
MLGLIIFGTRGITYGSEGGQFYCPNCQGRQHYLHRKVRRFFTLYFIPLIPLDLAGEYVECQQCSGTYKLEILALDPEAASAREEAEFRKAMRRILVLMMLADGVVEDSEIEAIQQIMGKLEGKPITRSDIEAEVKRAQTDSDGIEEYCKSMAGYLNDSGREMVVKAAILVASADGRVDESERLALATIASALNMSRTHFSGIIAGMTQPSGPPN